MGTFRTGSNIVGVEKEIEVYFIASDGEFESRGIQREGGRGAGGRSQR